MSKWNNDLSYFYSFEHLSVLSKNLYMLAPKAVVGSIILEDVLVLFSESKHVTALIFLLNNHYNYNFIIDLFSVDYIYKKPRFDVCRFFRRIGTSGNFLFRVENVNMFNYNNKILVVSHTDGYSDSIVDVFESAAFLERESFDLFGIFFYGNLDLRRILTDYGFNGFPLRKDFPLSGYVEVRFDDSFMRVVYEPVELTQEFRFFDFLSPWVPQK